MGKTLCLFLFSLFLGANAYAQLRDVVGIVTNQYSSISTPQILKVHARTRYLGKKCDLIAFVNIVKADKELKIKSVEVEAGSCFGFDPKKYFWSESASQQRGLPFALYKTQSGYALPAGLELMLAVRPADSSNDIELVKPILN